MITVIVPLYNRLPVFQRTLQSLCEQSLQSTDYKIVVVDDCSTDMPRPFIETQMTKYSNIEYIRHDKNLGLAAARNSGLARIADGWVLFLDSDIVADKRLLEVHASEHERYPGEKIAVISNILYPDEYLRGSNFSHYVQSRELGSRPESEIKHLDYQNLPPKHFAGGATSVSNVAALESGLFDSCFTTYGGEDIEYGVRLHKIGTRLLFCKNALVRHHDDISLDRYKLKLIECTRGQYKKYIESKSPELAGSSISLLAAISWREDRLTTIVKSLVLRAIATKWVLFLLEWFVRRSDRLRWLYFPQMYSLLCGAWMMEAIKSPASQAERVW